VVNGILFGVFGILAGAAVPIVMSLPGALIGTVAGLAMIGVLLVALQDAFGRSLGNQTGAFVALAVSLANITLLGISAPFWALVAGVAVSAIVDWHALSVGRAEIPTNAS